jgi:D-alanyl-lipoteichoic acid acyltransferase DltB (MBOAT superfamily)
MSVITNLLDKILPALVYNPARPLLFNSSFFLFFFLAIVLFYPFIAKRVNLRTWFLMLVSVYFYYKTSGAFVLLLILTALINFIISKVIVSTKSQLLRHSLFVLSVFWNLGSLGYYKYTNFIFTTINQIMGGNLPMLDIFLPVGISFFTFQTMSYTLDVYMKKLEPIHSFKDFVFFVAFFPQLVAGPIVRATYFIPQIRKQVHLDNDTIAKALILIMGGLIKKGVIADYISINYVDRVFENPTLFSGVENLIAVYGYAMQIYCDFSGYSDMAIGLAALLGFDLPINFDTPYKARSITEFWRRWHISLSTWLRDYLYVPLGGNRKGKPRQYANLLITMLLGGLWHGASWNFVFWGGLHGLGLMIDKLWLNLKISQTKFFRFISLVITFHFVCFCWIFFRSPNFTFAGQMLTQIFTNFNGLLFWEWVKSYRMIAILIAFGYFIHWLPERFEWKVEKIMQAIPMPVQSVVVAAVIWLVFQAKTSDIQPFIYFQF